MRVALLVPALGASGVHAGRVEPDAAWIFYLSVVVLADHRRSGAFARQGGLHVIAR